MGKEVPVWAFLLSTVFIALVGPWVTTLINNKQANKVRKDQGLEERSKRIMDRKIEAYDNAMTVLGRAKMGLAFKNSGQSMLNINEAMTRLHAYGSEDVRLAATDVEEEAITWSAHAMGTATSKDAYDKFNDAVYRLGRAMRVDMGTEEP